MSENYIVIDGKRAELTLEQLKALGLKAEAETPLSRAEKGKRYYYINDAGFLSHDTEDNITRDQILFNIGNYCTDETVIQQHAYTENLNRLLWRYSMEHDGDKIIWHNKNYNKYCIVYNHYDNEFSTSRWSSMQTTGAPCFYSWETAEAAIKEIIEPFLIEHPDFKYQEAM